MITIDHLTANNLTAHLDDLTSLLLDTVASGGAVGFILPLTDEDARAFWRDKVSGLLAGGRTKMFVAKDQDRIVGTVQLIWDLPNNQPHRGDVAKMMVHPDARRQGIGRRLMEAVETEARALDLKLLVLDTKTGDNAQALYAKAGFERVGDIPIYALDPDQAAFHSTTYMFKRL